MSKPEMMKPTLVVLCSTYLKSRSGGSKAFPFVACGRSREALILVSLSNRAIVLYHQDNKYKEKKAWKCAPPPPAPPRGKKLVEFRRDIVTEKVMGKVRNEILMVGWCICREDTCKRRQGGG